MVYEQKTIKRENIYNWYRLNIIRVTFYKIFLTCMNKCKHNFLFLLTVEVFVIIEYNWEEI